MRRKRRGTPIHDHEARAIFDAVVERKARPFGGAGVTPSTNAQCDSGTVLRATRRPANQVDSPCTFGRVDKAADNASATAAALARFQVCCCSRLDRKGHAGILLASARVGRPRARARASWGPFA
jgi:hypothetical protein